MGRLHWIASFLLLFQQTHLPDSLFVDQQGQSIAIVNRSEYTLSLPGIPIVDDDKFQKLMADLDRRAFRAPVNASLDGQGRIIPEQTGHKLNRRAFMEQFYNFMLGSGSLKVEVPVLTTYAKVDSEILASVREKPIGQYATFFNANNKNRSRNMALAAKAINNLVVFPGEMFSFNKVVGRRTAEKGYLRAPVIVRGELSEGIGGGICQISSTLFNAADHAGLHIVKRYSHSRNVPYVPPGRDATISWQGPDFSFLNKYNQPVLIRAHVYGGRVSIIISSSELIEYKPREVPSASKRLPEEVTDRNVYSDIQP